MKILVCVLLAVLLLAVPAAAGDNDATGLYTSLTAEQAIAEEAAANEILRTILLPDMSDGEKALAIHDWIVLNTSYSIEKYRDMDYGVIVEHKAICRGYARAFVYLAEHAGLSSEYTFSPELLHAWALTELDGSYYCADPTWDDNHYERIGFVTHRHFLFTTATEQSLSHYGEDNPLIAEGGIYENAPWQEAVTQVIFDGDSMYFINRDFELIRADRKTWNCEVLLQVLDHWTGFYEDYDPSLEAIATGLILRDGRLWFNTPHAVYSVPTDGIGLRCEYRDDTIDGFLCGIADINGSITVSVSSACKTLKYELREIG